MQASHKRARSVGTAASGPSRSLASLTPLVEPPPPAPPRSGGSSLAFLRPGPAPPPPRAGLAALLPPQPALAAGFLFPARSAA